MKIMIENTTEMVMLTGPNGQIECRVWEGKTERGVKVQCLIPRIAALSSEDLSQFESELREMRAPSAEARAFPLRMIL